MIIWKLKLLFYFLKKNDLLGAEAGFDAALGASASHLYMLMGVKLRDL